MVIQAFRVVFRLPLAQPHLAFQVHENIREQLADQKQYQTGMQKEDPRLFPTQFKPGNMSCDKVDQEQRPDDVPPWEPRNSQIRMGQREEKEEAFEVTVFRFINANVYLVQCAEEDQHHRTCQTEDSQLERGQRLQPAK